MLGFGKVLLFCSFVINQTQKLNLQNSSGDSYVFTHLQRIVNDETSLVLPWRCNLLPDTEFFLKPNTWYVVTLIV